MNKYRQKCSLGATTPFKYTNHVATFVNQKKKNYLGVVKQFKVKVQRSRHDKIKAKLKDQSHGLKLHTTKVSGGQMCGLGLLSQPTGGGIPLMLQCQDLSGLILK